MNHDRKQVDLGRVLNHESMDRAVLATGAYVSEGWRPPPPIDLDLARVEFADVSAAARLVAFVEGLVRAGGWVEVHLPAVDERDGEARYLASLEGDDAEVLMRRQRDVTTRVNARRRTASFLRHLGVVSALRLAHLPDEEQGRVQVSGGGDTARGGPAVSAFPAILPFRWVADRAEVTTIEWQERVIEYLVRQQLVTESDATLLVTTVFRELIENVFDHASDELPTSPRALFGAVTMNRSNVRYVPRLRESYPVQHPYFEWLGQRNSRIVRVVVADSGVGLPHTLRPLLRNRTGRRNGPDGARSPAVEHAELVHLAFDPTVSKDDHRYRRGAGLTVVRRFVRSYKGLVTVRAANVSAGYACQTGRPEQIAELDLHYTPGTTVELHIGPGLRDRERARSDQTDTIDPRDLVVLPCRGDEAAGALAAEAIGAVDAAGSQLPIATVLVEAWPRSSDGRTALAMTCREVAHALEGNAGLAVLLLAASDADCDTVFRTLDDLAGVTGPAGSGPDWCPPFLVVSATGRPTWAGGTHALRGLFYRMLEGETVAVAETVGGSFDVRSTEYLRLEADWLAGAGSGAARRIRVTPRDIDRVVATHLAARLEARLRSLPGAAS